MSMESCLKILKETNKPIYYKKGRHTKPILAENKERAIDLFIACEDGAIMEREDRVEIWDYDEIDWLS